MNIVSLQKGLHAGAVAQQTLRAQPSTDLSGEYEVRGEPACRRNRGRWHRG